ncbi:hypothetical protein [Streptomyces sp. NPDC018031]|uniref:hypothetical protein n=1 Tax=Streptomyces sp. NPDC018031 TaxID=3365033 RepID=UPI0037A12C6D
MHDIGTLLVELHDAETALADEFRAVAERQAADPGTHHPCHTLARQCDDHAARVRAAAGRHATGIPGPHQPRGVTGAVETARHWGAGLIGRHQHHPGLRLLRDLGRLYLTATAVDLHWILLGQTAQAVRDAGLLAECAPLHRETRTQLAWISTRLKEAAPQVLATGG